MEILSLTSITNDKGDTKMKYYKFTMYLDEYEDGEVITNSSEILIEDLTEKQEERLAEAFASLVKDNKAKMDKIVKEIR